MPPAQCRRTVPLAALALLAAIARPAAAQSPPVSAWPLRIDTAAGQMSVFQPQPDSFEGDQLTARAAVSLLPPGATEPQFGATWFTARVFTDRDARTVTIRDLTVRQVKLPNASADQEGQFAAVLKQQLPSLNVTFALDQLEATLTDVQKARVESQQLDNAPPRIVFATVPTTLVVLDGDPKLQPADDLAGGPGVMRVVNTPFILLLHLPSRTYFLKAGDTWMAAPEVTGPWQPAGGVPPQVDAVGRGLSVQNQQAPGDQPAASAAPAPSPAGPTQILVATTPTELVSSNGPPQYTPLPGNDLLYMANTAADVFLEVSSQRYFVLLGGRWFAAPGVNGPWAFVAANALPPSFALIPPDSAKGNVLVSVAGTQRALDARTDAYIPQTTAIRRDSGASLTVAYDGEPKFEPIADCPVTYASNCPDPVLYVDRSYYCCHQAVWYQAALAVGPWTVSLSVPQVIYTIPPSCPVYQCRYVYVYDSTPDVVYCGYLPGYTGCYVYGPTVVYGTGYRYDPWYGREFIPRPVTWGFAPRYDYDAATWGYGGGYAYGPTWFAGGPVGPVRHDWFGPQGYVDYREIHDSRTTVVNNYYGGGNRGGGDRGGFSRGPAVVNNTRNVTINNIYNRRENVTRNVNVSVDRSRTVNNVRNVDVHNTDVHNTTVRNGNDRAPVVNRGPSDDVYAGRDGQVYRRTDQGWQQRGSTGWSTVPDANRGQPARGETPRTQTPRTDTPRPETPRDTPDARRDVPRDTPDARRDVPRDTPDGRRDVPRDTPDGRRDVPRDTPARNQAPARVAQPIDPTGGLDQDRAARDRGNARSRGGDEGGGNAARGGGEGAGSPPRGSGGGDRPAASSEQPRGNGRAGGGNNAGGGGGGGNGGGGDSSGKGQTHGH